MVRISALGAELQTGEGTPSSNRSACLPPDSCLVLITPDSSEIRWVPAEPEPGMALPGRFPETWLVVDEVVRSGVTVYTVFGFIRSRGMDGSSSRSRCGRPRPRTGVRPIDSATVPLELVGLRSAQSGRPSLQ